MNIQYLCLPTSKNLSFIHKLILFEIRSFQDLQELCCKWTIVGTYRRYNEKLLMMISRRDCRMGYPDS